MTSLTALMASLPPASLADTDLARFCAQALGRRQKSELPGLAAAFGEETLRGYAPSLGPILQALVQTIVQLGLDPHALDTRTLDGLLGSAAFLGRLESKVPVQRQRLRPGTVIGAALRQTLGMRLLVLPGVGRELVLVAPVDLAQVPDAHFTVPLGIVLAKNAPPEEAEALRNTWATIEERFGLDGDEAAEWTARFFAISRLENHDAEAAAAGLAELTAEARAELWQVLVHHLRDNELPEQHRGGRRGLERRLGELGYLEAQGIPPWVEATMSLAESVYRAAGLDPEVMAGRCPVPREDVERWAGWVDVPAAGRERVKKLPNDQVAHLLARLAEEEAGRVERNAELLPEPLARALASLRDQCLRPRWQRSRWALAGIDPLHLARARAASGEDTRAIRRRLELLGHEAAAAERVKPKTRPRLVKAVGPVAPDAPAADGLDAALAIGAPIAVAPPGHPPDGAGDDSGDPLATTPSEATEPAAFEPAPESESSGDARGLRPSRFHLPPMPSIPPPRPAPRVRPRTDFPPMPMPGGPREPPRPTEPQLPSRMAPRAERPPSQRLASQRGLMTPAISTRPSEPIASREPAAYARTEPAPPLGEMRARLPEPRPPEATRGPEPRETTRGELRETSRVPDVRVADPEPSRPRIEPRLARPRTGATAPHLVTPSQGNHFYDTSFRELELIERDLVQRGPYPGASERIQAIATEAAELHASLGPSARSGDREFQAAQKRIEKVQAYLERIQPLLSSRPPLAGDAPTRGGLLGRLFGKK